MISDPLYAAYKRNLEAGPLHAIQWLLGDLAVESVIHGERHMPILFIRHRLEDILRQGGVKPPKAGSWIPLDRFQFLADIEEKEQ